MNGTHTGTRTAGVEGTLSAPMLARSMKLWETLAITLSAVAPASSVFLIAPGIIRTAGTGAFMAYAAGALVGLVMAVTYAELASAYPTAGGDYTIIGHTLGPFAGFVAFGVNLVTWLAFIAFFARGIGTYLGATIPGLPPESIAVLALLAASLIGILNVKTSARVMGLLLSVEFAALAVLAWLGFGHMKRPFLELVTQPTLLDPAGALAPTSLALIGLATTGAIFAFKGCGGAVCFGEETRSAPRHIARAIIWALAIATVCAIVPVAAVLLGAGDLKALFGSATMLEDFIAATGGRTLTTAIDLAIVASLFNALVALLLMTARILFSSGRDRFWPPAVNRALTRTHGRFLSPWIATLACGTFAALACQADPTLLLIMSGTGLTVLYGALAVAALVGRHYGSTAYGVYRMPFFPLPPIAALLACATAAYASFLDPAIGRPSLLATCGVAAVSILYYGLVLRPRRTWVPRGPQF